MTRRKRRRGGAEHGVGAAPDLSGAKVPLGRRLLAAALAASALLLFVAALPVWPTAYDLVLKTVVAASALFAAYVAYEERRTGWVVMLALIAVGFNPLWPLGLSRGNWVATYLVVALVFVAAAARFRRAPRGIFKPTPRIP